MKNLFSLFLVIFAYTYAHAQAAITEGQIVLELTNIVTDQPQMKQVLSGSTLTLQSKDNVFRSTTRMMGDQINIENYYDLNTKDNRIYLNLMGKKILTTVPDSVQQEKFKDLNDNSIITYDKNDTKEINGFTCYKALVESLQDDGSVSETHLYITKEVDFPVHLVGGLPQTLEGFPLEMTIRTNGMEMTYSFKNYSEKVDENFNTNPEGYTEMTYDEFMAGIGKQMGL